MFHPDMPLEYQDQIVTGDARRLARRIPSQSISLLFCDPVYQNLADYRWLAKLALRVLKPKGVLLTWCSKPKLGRSQLAMERAGMQYVYTLDYTVVAKTARMRWYNLFCWTTPCLWMQRPGEATRPRRWIPDTHIDTVMLKDDEAIEVRQATGSTFVSTDGPSGSYVWNKNLKVLRVWTDVFCPPQGTVLDVFAGEASIAAVCKTLGRHHVSFEIQPEVAARGRERLALFDLQPQFEGWKTLSYDE
jgi:DNA methylase